MPQAEVVATDLAPSTTELIQQHAVAEGVSNVTAQPADAQDLHNFLDKEFAVVTCSYGLMFMPDHKTALREACRVLQPCGLFVATVWAPREHFQFGWVRFQRHLAHLSVCVPCHNTLRPVLTGRLANLP